MLGEAETTHDKLRSILSQLEYTQLIRSWNEKGVPFLTYMYVPEIHSVTNEEFHERKDEGHVFKVAGAPIFTYTHEPDDNEIHNGCKTMLYYVRDALCKHTIMSFLYVSIQEK